MTQLYPSHHCCRHHTRESVCRRAASFKRASGKSLGGWSANRNCQEYSVVRLVRNRCEGKTEKPGGGSAAAESHCTKLKCAIKQSIIKELLVEATGVELFRVLITRNLLILGTATTAKKAPLPDPLYVYCTKMLFALESNRHHMAATVSHRFSGMDRKST
jgi:hypothetical protein